MKTNILDSFDQISTIWFLSTFKFACDTNGIYEVVAKLKVPFFKKMPAAVAPNFQKALSSK